MRPSVIRGPGGSRRRMVCRTFSRSTPLAPYILTALIARPKRLVYLSSGLHRSGDATLEDLAWERRPWQGQQAYSDTKLHDVLLAFAVARCWPGVFSNALEPGWVPTKMGGKGAPDDLDQGHRTQVWLAATKDHAAKVTGEYFYHLRPRKPSPATREVECQEKLLDACKGFSGVDLSARLAPFRTLSVRGTPPKRRGSDYDRPQWAHYPDPAATANNSHPPGLGW